MPDFRTMYDSEWLHEYDLPSDTVTVEIAAVEAGELKTQGGKKRQPVVRFTANGKALAKALALNKTNGKAIAQLYGNQVEAWVGKKITLFRTTTQMAGETVACIRVRKP